MTNFAEIIDNLKKEKIKENEYSIAAEYRDIQRWLEYKHPIEEIFENKNSYSEVVQKELLKLERTKKIEKLNEVKG